MRAQCALTNRLMHLADIRNIHVLLRFYCQFFTHCSCRISLYDAPNTDFTQPQEIQIEHSSAGRPAIATFMSIFHAILLWFRDLFEHGTKIWTPQNNAKPNEFESFSGGNTARVIMCGLLCQPKPAHTAFKWFIYFYYNCDKMWNW